MHLVREMKKYGDVKVANVMGSLGGRIRCWMFDGVSFIFRGVR